jgi:hypothetical protein
MVASSASSSFGLSLGLPVIGCAAFKVRGKLALVGNIGSS